MPMHHSFLHATALAAAIALSGAVHAQTATVMAGSAPGAVGVVQSVDVAASIAVMVAATRAVTLKGPQGRELSVVAGPEVKNFAQLKVGDVVNIKYAEALTLELRKGGGKPVAWTERDGAAAAKPGAMPGAVIGRQISVVGDVIAVDAAAKLVTVKGPKRTVELKVQDPEQLKLIKKGDQIEATFTEAVAVAVTPAKK
jgi:Cu/Ag efflux protein CusF